MSSISIGLAVVNVIYDICVTSYLVQSWQNGMSFIMLALVVIEAVFMFVLWEVDSLDDVDDDEMVIRRSVFLSIGRVFSSVLDLFPFIFAFQGAEEGDYGAYEQSHFWTLISSGVILMGVALYEGYTFAQYVKSLEEGEEPPMEIFTTIGACFLRLCVLYFLIWVTIWGSTVVSAFFWICTILPLILLIFMRFKNYTSNSGGISDEGEIQAIYTSGFCFLMTTTFYAGYHAVFIGNKFEPLSGDAIAPEDLCSPSNYYFYSGVMASMFIYTCLLHIGIFYQRKKFGASNESSVAAV